MFQLGIININLTLTVYNNDCNTYSGHKNQEYTVWNWKINGFLVIVFFQESQVSGGLQGLQ